MVKVTRLFGFGSICCCWCCASEKRASTIKRKSNTEREMSTGREAKKIRRKDSQLGLFCNISHTISEINAGIVFIFGVSVECSAKRGWSVCAPPFFYIHSRGYRQSMCSPYISAANSFDVFRKKKHFFLHSLCSVFTFPPVSMIAICFRIYYHRLSTENTFPGVNIVLRPEQRAKEYISTKPKKE